jgi:ABC-2 type transport system permease protein
MGFFLVMKAELVRSFIIMRRYWFATLIGLVIGYGILIVMIFGFMRGGGAENAGEVANQVGTAFEERAAASGFAMNATESALGFMLGMFAFGIVGLFTAGLQGMARTGELEQVYLSPHGLVTNFMARSFVASMNSIVTWCILLYLISRTVKGQLYVEIIPLTSLLFLTYFNLIGFGFMMGGLVLVFKQIGQVAMILRLGFIAIPLMVSDAIYDWDVTANPFLLVVRGLLHAVPSADAAICLKLVLIGGEGYGIYAHPSFFFLIVNGVVWTLIGIACFRMLENWSRQKGTLGAY